MHTETMQVQYVNPPNPGGKKVSIKTTDGKLFGVWANKLSEFKPNETYAVEYTEEEWRGQTYRTITKAALEANRTASTSPQPSRNSHRETSPTDAERMFVCSLLKAEIRSGKLSLNAKTALPTCPQDPKAEASLRRSELVLRAQQETSTCAAASGVRLVAGHYRCPTLGMPSGDGCGFSWLGRSGNAFPRLVRRLVQKGNQRHHGLCQSFVETSSAQAAHELLA